MKVSDENRLQLLLIYMVEDLGHGDITTESLGIDSKCKAEVVAKSSCIVAGLDAISLLFEHHKIVFKPHIKDGDACMRGDLIFELEGDAAEILKLERVVLNVISRMSGIATYTREMVKKVAKVNPNCIVAATRKTTPGFRVFEKEAVVIGGGHPHRFNLAEAVLIKDNHLKFFPGPKEALEHSMEFIKLLENAPATTLKWGDAKPKYKQKWIMIEADSYEHASAAVWAGADIVMLDNMSPDDVEFAYKKLKTISPNVLIEVSGGITPDNILEYAEYADIVSVGWLTHSAPSADFSMRIKVVE